MTLQRPLPPSPLTNGDMAHTGAFPSTEPSHRAAPSPSSSPMNGNGVSYAGNANIHMQPFPMSHQQDINYLYQQLQELSNLLQSNRERVNEVTRNADEVAVSVIPARKGDQATDYGIATSSASPRRSFLAFHRTQGCAPENPRSRVSARRRQHHRCRLPPRAEREHGASGCVRRNSLEVYRPDPCLYRRCGRTAPISQGVLQPSPAAGERRPSTDATGARRMVRQNTAGLCMVEGGGEAARRRGQPRAEGHLRLAK